MYQTYDPQPIRRERARTFAEKALQLQPDCAEGHLALGFFYYYGDRNYELALKQFALAEQGLPNYSEYELVGEQEKAMDLLDGLLSRPSHVAVAMLKISPAWERLRENPRFGALLIKHAKS